jgi:predicted dienelactone hydrolase
MVLVVAACGGDDEDATAPVSPGPSSGGSGGTGGSATTPAVDPFAAGPFAVGVTTVETGGDRSLPVEIWYPAKRGATGDAATYDLTLGALVLATLPSPLAAVRDAPIADEGGALPVLIFSHGSGGARVQSVFLTEHLASHGFIVAAPDHLGNTLREAVNSSLAIPTVQIAALRPVDVSRTLDLVLAKGESSGDPLFGRVDPLRVGVVGHSFGAFTALRIAGATIDLTAAKTVCSGDSGALCDGWEGANDFPTSARDARFLAAVALAPGGAQVISTGLAPSGYRDAAVPVMIQGGTLDDVMPYQPECVAPYETLPDDAVLVGLDHAGHFTFTDICQLMLGIDQLRNGCEDPELSLPAAHAAIQGFATAFFQVRVNARQDYAQWLGSSSVAGVKELRSK